MKKLVIAAVTVAVTAGGVALPITASASASPPSAVAHKKHPKHKVQQHPCSGIGIGVDIALGSKNICIPL